MRSQPVGILRRSGVGATATSRRSTRLLHAASKSFISEQGIKYSSNAVFAAS
jgi:hypothetical protein